MIRELTVKELNRRFNYEFEFYGDLNIFAGRIGSGKTTLLKLIWFLTSGNLHRVISEIPFGFISLDTSKFSLLLEYLNPNQVKLDLSFTEIGEDSETLLDLKQETSGEVVLAQKQKVDVFNERIAHLMKSSLYFPTFRRMERHAVSNIFGEALLELTRELSVGDHKFIAAVSTRDVIDILTQKHTEISEGINQDGEDYETLCLRWSELEQFIIDMFSPSYDGIWISENLTFHFTDDENGANIISSANLSSGEKQLLGFLCHNAFSKVDTMVIDEPELSLHLDWQRLLIPLLRGQGTEKQLFIATHSTEIMARYPNNLFVLNELRGENE